MRKKQILFLLFCFDILKLGDTMKILASDFDDTLYIEENPEQTRKNIGAIKKFISYGNIFCIITGRNYTSIKKLLNELKVPYTYLICDDGAKIFNSVDYGIDTTYLEEEDIKIIEKILKEKEWNYYLDDGYNKTNNINDCVKVVVNCSEKDKQVEIVNKIKENIKVYVYASKYHINIVNFSVNKANALKRLLNIENLSYNNLHVIGDNSNDYEMVKNFSGAIMKKHHSLLNDLGKKEYNELSDYINDLLKDKISR